MINLDDDDATDLGQKSKLQFSATEAGDSHEEVTFLQQELAELTTAIKEEKWYSGQLKDELDKVSAERDKLEEVQSSKKCLGEWEIGFYSLLLARG